MAREANHTRCCRLRFAPGEFMLKVTGIASDYLLVSNTIKA